MTMYPQITSTLSAAEWQANRQAMTDNLAFLAHEWGVDAVGRHYPTSHTRGDYDYVRAGKWYLVRNGERVPATASQSRALNRVGSALTTYGSIGPVAAYLADDMLP